MITICVPVLDDTQVDVATREISGLGNPAREEIRERLNQQIALHFRKYYCHQR